MADRGLKSDVMANIASFMSEPGHRENARELIELLSAFFDAKAVGYSLKFTYGKLMSFAKITDIRDENVIPMVEEKGWRKSRTLDKEHYIDSTANWILGNNVNEIYQKPLIKLCDFIQRINNRLVFTFKQLLEIRAFVIESPYLHRC